MKRIFTFILVAGALACSFSAHAQRSRKVQKQDLLIKLASGFEYSHETLATLGIPGNDVEVVAPDWIRVQAPQSFKVKTLAQQPGVEFVQPNYKIKLLEDFTIQDPLRRAALARMVARNPELNAPAPADNPAIPDAPQQTEGADPLFSHQWGMLDIGTREAWKITHGSSDMIVAVIDTGVDYTHEDLLPNIWRNTREIPDNGIDDDNNGYIDDVIGWDFASNDNKPFDLTVPPLDILFKGGNAGHGTHCAGNVAARGDNGLGISGVAPNVKIMPLRFITEKGQGTTADAIRAIRYAVDNGAKVMSNSWGSEGEDPSEGAENRALRDAVQYGQDKGVLFIAAAGNGHKGVGYDNDTDKAPSYPSSYDHDIIISVAALDRNDNLGSFSNWGVRTVDIGAPGVAVYSTMVQNQYSDIVIDKLGFKATWDGTSMATPHVAGAAALYWSAHPTKTWQEVKAAIIGSAKKINAMSNKSVSGGKLDVKTLITY